MGKATPGSHRALLLDGAEASGGGGIRTLDTREGISVFETPRDSAGALENQAQPPLTPSGSISGSSTPPHLDADLLKVGAVWSRLPAPIRAAVLALVRTAVPADSRFEWVLPGHGQRVQLPAGEMLAEDLRPADGMRGSDR
jgi:hypothetical protein